MTKTTQSSHFPLPNSGSAILTFLRHAFEASDLLSVHLSPTGIQIQHLHDDTAPPEAEPVLSWKRQMETCPAIEIVEYPYNVTPIDVAILLQRCDQSNVMPLFFVVSSLAAFAEFEKRSATTAAAHRATRDRLFGLPLYEDTTLPLHQVVLFAAPFDRVGDRNATRGFLLYVE